LKEGDGRSLRGKSGFRHVRKNTPNKRKKKKELCFHDVSTLEQEPALMGVVRKRGEMTRVSSPRKIGGKTAVR